MRPMVLTGVPAWIVVAGNRNCASRCWAFADTHSAFGGTARGSRHHQLFPDQPTWGGKDGTKVLLSGQGADEALWRVSARPESCMPCGGDRLVAGAAQIRDCHGRRVSFPAPWAEESEPRCVGPGRVVNDLRRRARTSGFFAYCMSTPPADGPSPSCIQTSEMALADDDPANDCRSRMQTGRLIGEDRYFRARSTRGLLAETTTCCTWTK